MLGTHAAQCIIREGVRSPCPLQMKARLPIFTPKILSEYESDASPLTTGPSSVLSTPGELSEDEETVELVYPEHNTAYRSYHYSTFPRSNAAEKYPNITVTDAGSPANDVQASSDAEVDVEDDPVLAAEIIRKNTLDEQLFAAICPWNLNEMSVFLYGRMASPQLLAEILANNPRYRVYEQAARMFPAKLRGFALATIGNTTIETLIPREGRSVDGYVLFSTSIRERAIIKENKGAAFEQFETHATVQVNGREVDVPVVTAQSTPKWMEHAIVKT